MNPGLIVELPVRGRPVLVVGAGPVGRRRAARLIQLGATLRWVAPDAPAGHCQRPFHPSDCDAMTLVVACAPPAVNAAVVSAARDRTIPVIRSDAAGDLRWLATIDRGPLQIALSTAGRAPAAARVLRRALASRVPAHWGALVDQIATLRARWTGRPERAERLRAALGGPLAAVVESGAAPDAEALARWLASIEAND